MNTKKKKVLFVVNSLGIGGAEKSLTALLNAMDYNRFEVDLLMFNPEGALLKFLPKEVEILPQLSFLRSNQSLRKQFIHPRYMTARIMASVGLRLNKTNRALHPAQCYWKYAGWAFNTIHKEYDTAIAWGQGNPTHYVAIKVNALNKIAFVNADYIAVGHNSDFDGPIYDYYNYVACVSNKLTEIMQMVFPKIKDKIITIYDINNAEMIEKMAGKYNPFENEKAEIILTTVGRLVPPKGYDLAISAAKILKENKVDFKWFIIGDGPLRSKIEQSIISAALEDKVILTGAKENPYVYMKNCNIYVQTSRYEGYCLTLAEARILNKPVISTNFDVVSNQIRNEENGLVVEMTGVAIAEGILRLIRDKALRMHIIKNLREEKKGNIEEIDRLYAII